MIKSLERFVTEEERRDLMLVEFLHKYNRKKRFEKPGNCYEHTSSTEDEDICYS